MLSWYRVNGRDLPWRKTSDPYAIWVSEVMLQQTQVATVLRYYERFLTSWPTVRSLARADEQELLHFWQGLGYYRRARQMRQAAQQVVAEHDGQFPNDLAALMRLPGLGPYTARAVASLAFGSSHGVLEANTIRLWTRVCAAEGDPKVSPLRQELMQLVDAIVPSRHPGNFNQGVMDIGARVCTPRSPNCDACPLRKECRARALGRPDRFPSFQPGKRWEDREHVSVVARAGSRVLISQCPADGWWAGLWEFPRSEKRPDEDWEAAARRAVAGMIRADFSLCEWLTIRHTVQRFRIQLKIFDARIPTIPRHDSEPKGRRWVAIRRLGDFPFSSPQRKVMEVLRQSVNPSA